MKRGLLVFFFLFMAMISQAHPLSVSYVDIRLDSKGIGASVEAEALDLAHDLPGLSQAAMMKPDFLTSHVKQIAGLVTSRLTLGVAGQPFPSTVEKIVPIPDQKAVKVWLRYSWRTVPKAIQVQCNLFPYHPLHETLVDFMKGMA